MIMKMEKAKMKQRTKPKRKKRQKKKRRHWNDRHISDINHWIKKDTEKFKTLCLLGKEKFVSQVFIII